jgi:hypothetical protein
MPEIVTFSELYVACDECGCVAVALVSGPSGTFGTCNNHVEENKRKAFQLYTFAVHIISKEGISRIELVHAEDKRHAREKAEKTMNTDDESGVVIKIKGSST